MDPMPIITNHMHDFCGDRCCLLSHSWLSLAVRSSELLTDVWSFCGFAPRCGLWPSRAISISYFAQQKSQKTPHHSEGTAHPKKPARECKELLDEKA